MASDGHKDIELEKAQHNAYHVDVSKTVQKAREELLKPDVQSIKLRAKGQEITKVSLIAIRLEEMPQLNCKIVKMHTDNETEQVKDEADKKHLVLEITLQKNK